MEKFKTLKSILFKLFGYEWINLPCSAWNLYLPVTQRVNCSTNKRNLYLTQLGQLGS